MKTLHELIINDKLFSISGNEDEVLLYRATPAKNPTSEFKRQIFSGNKESFDFFIAEVLGEKDILTEKLNYLKKLVKECSCNIEEANHFLDKLDWYSVSMEKTSETSVDQCRKDLYRQIDQDVDAYLESLGENKNSEDGEKKETVKEVPYKADHSSGAKQTHQSHQMKPITGFRCKKSDWRVKEEVERREFEKQETEKHKTEEEVVKTNGDIETRETTVEAEVGSIKVKLVYDKDGHLIEARGFGQEKDKDKIKNFLTWINLHSR